MPSSLGPAEILVILVIALIVLGPKRLPEAGRQVGKALAEVRRWSTDVKSEIRNAVEPDPPGFPAPAPEPPPGVPAGVPGAVPVGDVVPPAPPPPTDSPSDSPTGSPLGSVAPAAVDPSTLPGGQPPKA